MPKENQPQDFGEKIGGARKDLWKERGLMSEDLDAMNDREIDKYVKKDNIWKKPDYEDMIEKGIPSDVAYFIKLIRDGLPAKPVYTYTDITPKEIHARQKQYIETVLEVKAIAETIESKEDVMAAFRRLFLDGGYMEQSKVISRGYSHTPKSLNNPVITNKLIQAMYIPNDSYYMRKMVLLKFFFS